jgi:hypothetical protein
VFSSAISTASSHSQATIPSRAPLKVTACIMATMAMATAAVTATPTASLITIADSREAERFADCQVVARLFPKGDPDWPQLHRLCLGSWGYFCSHEFRRQPQFSVNGFFGCSASGGGCPAHQRHLGRGFPCRRSLARDSPGKAPGIAFTFDVG